MSLVDWPRVESLFHRLAPLEPAERESLLLEISSEDPALGDELVSLLAAHDGPGVLDRLTKKLAPVPHGAVAPGDELAGTSVAHFEIEALIGRGGMGDVYKARDSRLGRDVALKFLPPWLGRDPAARDRFLVEARIVSSIDHPNVCTLLEMGETDDGRLFLILPYYEGETLKRRLGREALEPAEAIDVALQVARGLSAAHDRGVVHRDIKPANLLLTANGRVKILDFGVAKLADVSLTRTGETPGTAVYMSPEQAAGRAVDERTDLWSLGVVVHEMITGTRPDPPALVSAGGLRDRAGRPLPPALVAVLEGLLARTPAERYPDAHSVASDLEVLAADPSSAARPAFSLQRFLAELKRRHVFKVAAVYGIAGFGVMQAAEVMFPRIPLPEWTVALVVWLVLLGFPIALVLAWAFEATPHGVRRTHRVRPAILDAIVAQPARRRWPVGMAALLGGVLLVGSGIWLVARDRPGGAMPPPAAQAGIGVVVMPFAVVGETDHLQIWSEGPVHLLGELIDGLEGLRSIDVMTAWNQRFGEGVAPPASGEQLELAGDLGGSLVVRGRAVGTRDSVVLTAEVSDLRSGESGSVRVRGAAEDLSLGERLTMEMLREGLLPADGVAEGNLAAATTRSWEAFASFLEGERAYRRGRYEDASASFVRAVELDSTFARAMYRAAQSFMWRGNFDFESEYRDRAERFAAATTRRDSLLYTAYPQDRSPQAIERLERFVRLYPDDFDGWIHLGEAYYHLGGRALRGPEHYRNAWTKAIEEGGVYYAESYHHLLEDAFARRDSARARELLSGYAALDHDASACPGMQLVYSTSWGDEVERARALDEIRSVDTGELGCAWVSIAASSAATEDMERRDRARLSSLDEETAGITLFRMLQARVMRGDLRAAAAVLEFAAESGFSAWAAAYDVHLHLTIPAWTLRAASIPLLESMEPWAMPKGFAIDNASPFWLGVGAVEEGRWDGLEEVLHRLEAAADTLTIREAEDRGSEWPANRDPAAEALELAGALTAYAALKRESSAKNLARFEEALSRMTWIGPTYLRYAVGLHLLERGDHRGAVRYFSSFYPYQWVQYVPAQYYMARAYERLGQLDQAREHYRIFIGWWATADPELGPWVEEARAALARLN